LGFMDLKDFADRNPHALSTGEKQRVALAAALVSNPDITVLDEPMAYLDFDAKTALIRYLCHLKKDGKSIVIVTHHQEYYKALADSELNISTGGVLN
jgi:energy-coupling factor transporter ATP-binding protein EcfA2